MPVKIPSHYICKVLIFQPVLMDSMVTIVLNHVCVIIMLHVTMRTGIVFVNQDGEGATVTKVSFMQTSNSEITKKNTQLQIAHPNIAAELH